MIDLKVSDCYICYLDILGYKSNLNHYGESKFLQIIDSIANETMERINRKTIRYPTGDFQYRCRIFSDNILIFSEIPQHLSYSQNINPRCRYDLVHLSVLIDNVIVLQREFIKKYGVLLRGAITSGSLYVNDKYVYGNGLIKAYSIESNISYYPRIIVDDCLVGIFDEETLKCNRINKLLKADDGLLFLDYLLHYPEDNYLEFHKKFIEKNLQSNQGNIKVLQKYLWCKEYHNKKCHLFNMSSLCIKI